MSKVIVPEAGTLILPVNELSVPIVAFVAPICAPVSTRFTIMSLAVEETAEAKSRLIVLTLIPSVVPAERVKEPIFVFCAPAITVWLP